MSYDIYCYKSTTEKPDINEASKVIEDDNDIWVKKPYNYETKTAIENALLNFDTTLEGFDYKGLAEKKKKTVEEVKMEFIKFELSTIEGEPEIQLEIYDYHVAITIPFIYQGDKAKRIFEKLEAYIGIIRKTAGYFVYDPQSGEAFDPTTKELNGLAKYLSVSAQFGKNTLTVDNQSDKKHWWKFW